MSDDEYNAFGLKMEEFFGDKLVDQKVFPKVFEYQAKLTKWVLDKEKENVTDRQTESPS